MSETHEPRTLTDEHWGHTPPQPKHARYLCLLDGTTVEGASNRRRHDEYFHSSQPSTNGDGGAPAALPGQPKAPTWLHEALDRTWQSIRQDGDPLAATSDDADEDVLEQLRQLTTDEIARAGFVLAIMRSLAHVVRADRHAASAAAVADDADDEE